MNDTTLVVGSAAVLSAIILLVTRAIKESAPADWFYGSRTVLLTFALGPVIAYVLWWLGMVPGVDTARGAIGTGLMAALQANGLYSSSKSLTEPHDAPEVQNVVVTNQRFEDRVVGKPSTPYAPGAVVDKPITAYKPGGLPAPRDLNATAVPATHNVYTGNAAWATPSSDATATYTFHGTDLTAADVQKEMARSKAGVYQVPDNQAAFMPQNVGAPTSAQVIRDGN